MNQSNDCNNDADTRIVQQTVERAEIAKTHVELVGDDTGLLVVALHAIKISGAQQKVVIMRPSSDSFIHVQMIYQSHTREVIEDNLPIHALSGCDTISSLYEIGKTKLVQLVT